VFGISYLSLPDDITDFIEDSKERAMLQKQLNDKDVEADKLFKKIQAFFRDKDELIEQKIDMLNWLEAKFKDDEFPRRLVVSFLATFSGQDLEKKYKDFLNRLYEATDPRRIMAKKLKSTR